MSVPHGEGASSEPPAKALRAERRMLVGLNPAGILPDGLTGVGPFGAGGVEDAEVEREPEPGGLLP